MCNSNNYVYNLHFTHNCDRKKKERKIMVLYREYIKDGKTVKVEIEDLPQIVDNMQVKYSLGFRSNEVYSTDFIDPIDYLKGK